MTEPELIELQDMVFRIEPDETDRQFVEMIQHIENRISILRGHEPTLEVAEQLAALHALNDGLYRQRLRYLRSSPGCKLISEPNLTPNNWEGKTRFS